MTFDELIPAKEDLYKTNEESLAAYSDEEVINLYLDIAKTDVKMDIQRALSLDVSDDSELNSITDQRSNDLIKAIAKRQLYYFYSSINDGESSYAARKTSEYKQAYESYKLFFSQLKSKVTAKIASFPISL